MYDHERIARKAQAHRRTTSDSKAATTKAGKKRGPITEPPAPSEENLSRRIMGEQQFVARRFPKLTCSCCPGKKGRPTACAYDSGLRWDKDRKQIILPPKMAAKLAEEAA